MICRLHERAGGRDLKIKRNGTWQIQYCPRVHPDSAPCGEWCPLFETHRRAVTLHCSPSANSHIIPFETEADATKDTQKES